MFQIFTRTALAITLAALVIVAGSLGPAGASPAAERGEDEIYWYTGSSILCKTRTTDDDVQQVKWGPVYQMSGDERHVATKIYMQVRVEPADGGKKRRSWTTGKKSSVTPHEYFQKWKRVWSPWVDAKREWELDIRLVWHRPTLESDYVVRQSPVDIPTADSDECEAV